MELLKKLTEARGVSGHESMASAVFKDLLSEWTLCYKVLWDLLVNII